MSQVVMTKYAEQKSITPQLAVPSSLSRGRVWGHGSPPVTEKSENMATSKVPK
jgi:hypothetical protein